MVDPKVLLGLDPGPGSMVKTRVRVSRTRVMESLVLISECTNFNGFVFHIMALIVKLQPHAIWLFVLSKLNHYHQKGVPIVQLFSAKGSGYFLAIFW